MEINKINYHYRRKARTIAIRNFFISMSLYSVMGYILFLYITKDDFPLPVLLITSFLGLLIGTVFLKQGLKLFNNKGVWEITINSSGLIWKSPDNEIDTSFNYKLNEIESSQTIVKSMLPAKNPTFTHYLILKSGERHELPGHTGVNLKKVISTLEKLGIKNDYKHIPSGAKLISRGSNGD